MSVRQYATVSAVNLVFLIFGFALGHEFYIPKVQAQQLPLAQAVPTPEIEPIQPVITAGSAAFGTLLAGRIASDEIAIKGLDLAKFDENLLNLLSTKVFFTRTELQSLADRSKADKILTMKPPPQPQPSAIPPEKKP